MLITKEQEREQSDDFPDRSVIAVKLEDVVDSDTAGDLIDGVVTAARLLDLPEVHIWATGDALPMLAVAAGMIDELPEGFQLRQLNADAGNDATGALVDENDDEGATWLTYDSLVRLARSRRAACEAVAA